MRAICCFFLLVVAEREKKLWRGFSPCGRIYLREWKIQRLNNVQRCTSKSIHKFLILLWNLAHRIVGFGRTCFYDIRKKRIAFASVQLHILWAVFDSYKHIFMCINAIDRNAKFIPICVSRSLWLFFFCTNCKYDWFTFCFVFSKFLCRKNNRTTNGAHFSSVITSMRQFCLFIFYAATQWKVSISKWNNSTTINASVLQLICDECFIYFRCIVIAIARRYIRNCCICFIIGHIFNIVRQYTRPHVIQLDVWIVVSRLICIERFCFQWKTSVAFWQWNAQCFAILWHFK